MTWARIEPYSSGASRGKPVTVSSSGAGTRHRPFLTVTVRRDQLPGLSVLARGSTCQVLAGTGEHAGQLRLHAGADFLCKAPTGGNTKADTVTIRLPLPPGLTAGKRVPVAVEHDYQASWLVLTLPDWDRPAPAPPPHRSITERVADPAAAKRGARA